MFPLDGGHLIDDGGRRGDQVDAEFPLEALLDDLHVEQPEKAAAETEAERHRIFRFEGEGGVIQPQFFQGIPQGVVFAGIDRDRVRRRPSA